jgi:hypothetical protein
VHDERVVIFHPFFLALKKPSAFMMGNSRAEITGLIKTKSGIGTIWLYWKILICM